MWQWSPEHLDWHVNKVSERRMLWCGLLRRGVVGSGHLPRLGRGGGPRGWF